MASCPPFFAADDSKMGADCGECPAVMERPHYWNIMLFNISKQKGQINVASVKIMQMNNIRGVSIHLFQEAHCLDDGPNSLEHGKFRYLPMEPAVPFGADRKGIFQGQFPFSNTAMGRNTLDPAVRTEIMYCLGN